MNHSRQFHDAAARIQRESQAFVQGIEKDLAEYQDMLLVLKGDELSVMQGRGLELKRILELLRDGDAVAQKMR